MRLPRQSIGIQCIYGLMACIILAGCSGENIKIREAIGDLPLRAEIGPVLSLTRGLATGPVRVQLDHHGDAHVLFWSPSTNAVRHTRVKTDGETSTDTVYEGAPPRTIDATVDAQGSLHVLVNDRQYVLRATGWEKYPETPWGSAGLSASGARFVAGFPDLAWSFVAEGTDVSAPGRWVIYGFGGPMGAIVWPWYTHGTKLVLAFRQPGVPLAWVILDHHLKENAPKQYVTGSDRSGNVSIYYGRSDQLYGDDRRHVRFNINELADTSGVTLSTEKRNSEQLMLTNLEGHRAHFRPAILAINERGDKLLSENGTGATFIKKDGEARGSLPPLAEYKSGLGPMQEHILAFAPAGNENFHALIEGVWANNWTGGPHSLKYAHFSTKGWSDSIEIGTCDDRPLFGVFLPAHLGSNRNERAFVAWVWKGELKGRWIEAGAPN